MTHANPQQKTGGWVFRKGSEGMNNAFADIFKAVSLMEPNRKLFKMTELYYNNKDTVDQKESCLYWATTTSSYLKTSVHTGNIL